MTVKFDHNLINNIAENMLEYDANLDAIKVDFEKNFGSNVTGEVYEIPGMDDWMVGIENEFRDVAEEYIDNIVGKMSTEEMLDWIEHNVDDNRLENYVYDLTNGETENVEDLTSPLLRNVVYDGLTDHDFATGNPFIDFVLYDFSYLVASSLINQN